MHIAILSRNPFLYSTRRLYETAVSRGHRAHVLDTLQLAYKPENYLSIHEGQPIDGIVPRIGASITKQGIGVVRQFEAAGVLTTASAHGIAKSRSKLLSLRVMEKAGLPIPKTAVIETTNQMTKAIEKVGLPLIVKLSHGTQGRGVLLAHTWQAAMALAQKLATWKQPLLVQSFVAEADGRDLRLLVVGERCVAAMERTAAPGEYRANLHMGGTAKKWEPSDELVALALSAAKAHELTCCGVDIIQSKDGPLLLELNSSPGLEGIEMTTGKDVAGEIIHYLERMLSQVKS